MHSRSRVRSSVCVVKPRLICTRVLMLSNLGVGVLKRKCAQAQMLKCYVLDPRPSRCSQNVLLSPISNGILASIK